MMVDGQPVNAKIIETDPAKVAHAIRRLMGWGSVLFALGLGVLYLAHSVGSSRRGVPSFHEMLAIIVICWVLFLLVIWFIVPLRLKRSEVLLGEDFVAGPLLNGPVLLFNWRGYKWGIKFDEITRVNLSLSAGHIRGAVIFGPRPIGITMHYVKEPAAVIETILDNTGNQVTWVRWRGFRFTKLTREDVRDILRDSARLR